MQHGLTYLRSKISRQSVRVSRESVRNAGSQLLTKFHTNLNKSTLFCVDFCGARFDLKLIKKLIKMICSGSIERMTL